MCEPFTTLINATNYSWVFFYFFLILLLLRVISIKFLLGPYFLSLRLSIRTLHLSIYVKYVTHLPWNKSIVSNSVCVYRWIKFSYNRIIYRERVIYAFQLDFRSNASCIEQFFSYFHFPDFIIFSLSISLSSIVCMYSKFQVFFYYNSVLSVIIRP